MGDETTTPDVEPFDADGAPNEPITEIAEALDVLPELIDVPGTHEGHAEAEAHVVLDADEDETVAPWESDEDKIARGHVLERAPEPTDSDGREPVADIPELPPIVVGPTDEEREELAGLLRPDIAVALFGRRGATTTVKRATVERVVDAVVNRMVVAVADARAGEHAG